jgi:diacylglycerol diphosphate phosphatase/phosphatidate phosphatase
MSSFIDIPPTISEEAPPRNASETKPPTASELDPPKTSRVEKLKPGYRNAPPFKTWLKTSWLDITTQLACLLIAELIYLLATPLMPRYFPLFDGVWTTSWGLRYGKPLLAEYITTLVSAIISFAVPFLVMGAIGFWYVRDYWESNAAVSTPGSEPFPR